ncbi:MAG: hypothetical protein M1836_008013 [Candelina mexicana]|nr:MAG: hypothetical protein M1836_008013 [Candelina mexicana]
MMRYCCDLYPEREYQDTVGENPALLLVSHHLHDETTSYLYSSNKFLFSEHISEYERPHPVHCNDITENFHYWLLTIGATNRRKIKHLIVESCVMRFEPRHLREVWGLLAAGHGLRTLKIELLGVWPSDIEWRGMGVGRFEVEIRGRGFAGKDDFMDEDKLTSTIEEYIDDDREEMGNCVGTVITDEEIERKVQELYVAFRNGIAFKDFGNEQSWGTTTATGLLDQALSAS